MFSPFPTCTYGEFEVENFYQGAIFGSASTVGLWKTGLGNGIPMDTGGGFSSHGSRI